MSPAVAEVDSGASTAPALSRGEGGSEGFFAAQRAVALSVMMERARANQEARLTCPLGSALYPFCIALSYTPCGARCTICLEIRPRAKIFL